MNLENVTSITRCWIILIQSSSQLLSKKKPKTPNKQKARSKHILFSDLPCVLQFGSADSPRTHKQDRNDCKGKEPVTARLQNGPYKAQTCCSSEWCKDIPFSVFYWEWYKNQPQPGFPHL